MRSLVFGLHGAAARVRARLCLGVWMMAICLLSVSGGVQAMGCPPQTITVASGSPSVTDLSDCAVFGINGYQNPPQHGTNDNRNTNGTGLVYYTNNGDGATTDTFSVIDSEDFSIIVFTVNVQQPGPSITTTTLPDAAVGAAYTQSLAASGGSTPYSWTLNGGALPAGLTLSSAGVVSGTPTQTGSFNPVFTVTDSANRTASRTISLNVSAPTLAITPTSLPTPVIGVAYSQALGTSGGTAPYTYVVSGGSLPPGISVSSGGSVSGSATTPGTFNFTVRSTDSSTGTGAPFSTTRTYSVTVSPPTIAVAPATLPNPTVGAAYSQTVSASGGTAPYMFAVTAGATPAGVVLSAAGVLSGTPTAAGTFNFTVTATDNGGFTGSRAYTFTVAAPAIAIAPASLANAVAGQAYSSTVTASGGTAPYAFAFTAGSLPSGMTLSSTGVLSGTSTMAGTFNFTVSATDSSTGAGAPFSGSRAYSLTVAAPSVIIAPATLPNPTVGAAYSRTVTASGGTAPYTFAVTAGATPSGLSLSPAGVLSGTPTSAGTVNFTVTATDGNGFNGARTYNVTVGGPTLVLTPTSQPAAHVGQAYSASFTTTGGTAPYHHSVTGSLPAGLSLADNGTLSGTPTQAGNFPVAIHVIDSSTGAGSPFTATVNLTLTVDADPLVLTPASTALTATYGASNSIVFTSSGGSAPRTLSITGAIPAGMSFDPASGVLSGTPSVTGSFSFTVTVTDAGVTPATLSQGYTLTIAAVTIVVSPATLPGGTAGTAYSGTLAASGGLAPYTFAVSAGALPPGITMSTSGALAGTPTQSGVATFTIRASDVNGMSGAQAYSITLGEAAPIAVNDVAQTPANQAVTLPLTANDTGVISTVAVVAAPAHGVAVVDGTSVIYTPARDFFGTDGFTYTAFGPGGTSNVATVTVSVQAGAVPVVQDQSVSTLSGQTIKVDASRGANGGPFTAVALATMPALGTATVDGTTIAYAAPADSSGTQRFTYTLSNTFGASQPATVTVTINPLPVAPPVSAAAVAGRNVRVNISAGASGGPFTGADVISVAPASAGRARIERSAEGYAVVFDAAPAFAGLAQISYTLTNAYATSAPGVLSVSVAARPDPSKDPEVVGVLSAQADATRRLAMGQISNFQRRLEQLHNGQPTVGFSNGITLTSASANRATATSERNRDRGPSATQDLGATSSMLADQALVAPRGNAAGLLPGGASVWTGGAVSFGKSGSLRGDASTDFTTSGVSIGADKLFADGLVIGAGVGYGRDDTDVGNAASSSKVDSYSAAVYASYRPTDAFFIDSLLGYQWLSLDSVRSVTETGGRVVGNRDGTQWFGSLSMGYILRSKDIQLTPYGRFDAAQASLDGFTERGDDFHALSYQAQTVRASTASAGVLAQFAIKRDYGVWAPQLRAEYGRDLEGSSSVWMTYADLAGNTPYRANLLQRSRDHALLGGGLSLQTSGGWNLTAEYQVQLESEAGNNQSVRFGIEKQFDH